MRQLLLNLATQPLQTLAGFVPGRNAELLAVLNKLQQVSPVGERFIYIWGEAGAGKTHLLHAMASAGIYVDVSVDKRLDITLSDKPIVAIDNVDYVGEEGAIDLFNIYNAMKDGQGVLLVSGQCPAGQLNLRRDLVTRLAWGLAFQVHSLTDEEKLTALCTRAKDKGFELKPDVANYLLTHWRRDMPSLFSALDELDKYSLETKRLITIPLLREAIALRNG